MDGDLNRNLVPCLGEAKAFSEETISFCPALDGLGRFNRIFGIGPQGKHGPRLTHPDIRAQSARF